MKQLYPTNFTFTFRSLPLHRNTSLFLLIFLLNFSFGFGQGVTISSDGDEGPVFTQQQTIPLTFEFAGPINGFDETDINVDNGALSDFFVETPDFDETNEGFLLNTFQIDPFNLSEDDARPSILAIDYDNDGNLYVLTFGNGIFVFDEDGNSDNIVEGDEFEEPLDIVIDRNLEKIYVADSKNNRIAAFDFEGNSLPSIGLTEGLETPFGLAVDRENRIYVADSNNDRVVIFRSDGSVYDQIDNGEGDGTNQLDNPIRIAVDDEFNVYVTDIGNNRVQIFNNLLNHKATIDGGSNNLRSPGSLVVDEYGFLYVADLGENLDFNDFTNIDSFDDLEFGEILTLVSALSNPISFIRVFRKNSYQEPEESITDGINLPIDLAFKNCGFLAVNDFSIGGFISLTFNLDKYNRLPDSFTANLEITEQCLAAKVSVGENVGEDAECNNTPASGDTFIATWDQTKPVRDICVEDDITVPSGFVIPNYIENGEVSFEDNCEGNLEVEQTPAPGTEIAQQTTTVRIIATDEAGNVSDVCSFDLVVEEEEEPLTIINCNYDTIEFTADENCQYILDDFRDDFAASNEDAEIFQDPEPGILVSGEVIVTLTPVLDGEEGEPCSFTIKSDDITPPVISDCPPENIEFTIQEGETHTLEDYTTQVSVTDNCDNDPVITQQPAAGDEITSDQEVILTATDAAGNESEICRFTVEITVEENNPAAPKFDDCPTLIQRNVNTDECQARVDFDAPTASDDSGELAVTLVSDLGSGDLFPVGSTTVTYEATGENGETISCSFEVVVVDNMSPEIISCPDNIEIEIAADENSTPVTYTVPEFTDNCGVVDIQRNGPASGESFSLGRTVVTYTASDEEGNEISCSFEVLVEREDEEPAEPEYRCIEEEDIPDIRLNENCEWEEPDYFRLIETENFTAEFTQTYEQLTENTLYFTIEIRNEANGELVGECSFSANIIDLMPPKITCPGDQVENFDPEEGFVIPDYENMASFSDNCGEVTFQQRPVPGEVIFEDTMVTLTAFDENGLATPCTFEIQLSQGNELNIGCQIDQNVNPDEDCRFTLPDYTDTGNLNFPEADVTQSPAPGTVISANTQITLTATLDRQTDECVFMVNLIDNEDPVANCVSGYIVNLDSSGNATLAPEVLDNNSTDNCGIISMGLSQTEFTRADIGEVPITLTVRDDAGNTDTCETTVEVVDEASGQFECRENVVVNLNENGEAVVSLQDLYTGNASGLTLEASRLDFSCSDLGVVQIQLDYSGAQTGSCTINVEVRDEIPPVINTDIVELTLDDQGFAYLEESDVLAENNCGQQLIYRFSKSVFNCEDVGSNTVNVEVEDANGNITEKNIEVRINGEACEIPDNEDLEFLFIYPNPNNGIFTIATPEGMLVEQVRVFDSRGRFILQKEYKDIARFYRMTIEGVAASVYTLQIFTNEGVIVKRVIISR